jgi:hypothetical protein
MTYNDLAKTFEMLAAHKPEGNGIVMDWATRDEWGIDLNGFELTPSEIRMLAEMGWCIWCKDVEYEEMAAWYKPETASDEELVEIFNQYKSIYKYT